MIKTIRAAVLAGTLLLVATPASRAQMAMDFAMAMPESEIRVVNNHLYRIRVVLVDAEGRHTSLGRVAPSKAAIFTLDEAPRRSGPVQVKVFADEPVWSAGNTGDAIRSQDLFLHPGTAVYVWVETDLTRTQFSVTR
jgi:hypothetical protein